MACDYTEKVLELAAVLHPVETPTVEEWHRLESGLGTVLPDDLKHIVSNLGSGHFGDLGVINPASSSPYLRRSPDQLLAYQRDIAWIAEEARLPLFPRPHGFLWVGEPGYGSILMVELDPVRGSSYRTCWFDLDLRRSHILRMSVCRFLHDLYLGLIAEDWARETRELLWQLGGLESPFFTSRPGLVDRGNTQPLN